MKKFYIPQVSEKHRLGSRAGSDAGKAGAADQVVCIPGGFMLCLVLRWGAFAGWIGCPFVCAAHEVVHTGAEIVGQLPCQFQRQRPLAPLVLGIEALVAHKHGRQKWTICPKIYVKMKRRLTRQRLKSDESAVRAGKICGHSSTAIRNPPRNGRRSGPAADSA